MVGPHFIKNKSGGGGSYILGPSLASISVYAALTCLVTICDKGVDNLPEEKESYKKNRRIQEITDSDSPGRQQVLQLLLSRAASHLVKG